MTATELTNTVRELKELKLMASDLAADIETLEDRIKAEMTVRNPRVLRGRWSLFSSLQKFPLDLKATSYPIMKMSFSLKPFSK